MTIIRTFQEIGANDVGVVGGKGANLGEMTRAGLPVPPGFCVTAEAYRSFIAAINAGDTIRSLLAEARMDDPEEVEARTERIRAFLTGQKMPADIGAQILSSYHTLADQFGDQEIASSPNALLAMTRVELPVAVRSSATAEDLPTASFAGQQDTYLNVRGDDELLENVKRCWASLWTGRAVTYRVKQGFDHDQVALAVVVQAMIRSEVSGILFTANPVTHSRDEVVINASWGLGEAIVSGLVTPDMLIVRKSDGVITTREIASKDLAVEYADEGRTAEREVPADRRNLPALSDAEIERLVAVGKRIEDHYRVPMDIEWGYARGEFYILQARAITTLAEAGVGARAAESQEGAQGVGADLGSPHLGDGRPPLQKGEYNRTMFIEIFPDPLSPSFLSAICPLFRSMLAFTFETLGFTPPRDIDAIGVYYNQPYFHREYIEQALKPLSPPVRKALVAQMVNPFGRHERGLPFELSAHYLGMLVRLLRFMTGFPSRLPGILERYRTEIKAAEALDLEKMSDSEVTRQVNRLVFTGGRQFLNYDFLIIAVIGISFQMLGTLLGRYFGNESEEVRSKLVSGVTGNATMETNKRIWDLAAKAKASPALSSALRRLSGAELRTELRQSQEGRDFLADLDEFLREYGHREVRMDILYPTWSEDPGPVLSFIRAYLDVAESSSPHLQQERLIKQREDLVQTVRSRMGRDWRGRVIELPLFNWILKHTQVQTRERDTMHFELTRLLPPFRRMLFELGRRWSVRGILATPEDIFFLTLEEMVEVAETPRPMEEMVARRRVEYQQSRIRKAPGIIRDGEEISQERTAFAAVAGQLRGVAGSPGVAHGIARVIRGPEEFHMLQSGEILVAPLTNPVWTPLFAIAGGLVTEVGGILSHGAIVAREYGIPAVMAASEATKILQEGQPVTVDGNKGIVLIDQ